MRQRLILLGVAAVLAAVLGVGYAASVGNEQPTHAPNLAADEVYVAGPDGEALKCNGKLAKVKRSALGGRTPPLTPDEAAQQSVLVRPRVKVPRCEKSAKGDETGPGGLRGRPARALRSAADETWARARSSRPRLVTLRAVIWELVFMLVILKIPVVYLCWVVWWAIRAEPEPLEGAGRLAPVLPTGARVRLAAATARAASARPPRPARRGTQRRTGTCPPRAR